jgi:hypothetical protein
VAAAELIPALVAAGQPALDQGVRSVAGAGEPVWAVGGSAENARIGLRGLTDESAAMRDLAHDVYVNNLGQGRDVNEFLKDITDIAVLSTRLPVGLIFSLQTRIQQILIDAAATSVLSGAMTCTRDAAALSGEFAFQPARPLFRCQTPVPLNLGDFFGRLFSGRERSGRLGRLAPPAQSAAPEFDAALSAYRAAVDALRAALSAGDPAVVRARADELLAAAQTFSEEAAPVLARLDPAAEGANAEEQMALGVAVTTVRLDALFVMLAADAWLADPATADPAAFNETLLAAGENIDLLGRVQAQVPLSAAPDAPLPVVDAPAELSAQVGETVAVPVRIVNAGGRPFAGARLTLEVDGRPVAEAVVPDLGPGESTEALPTYTPPAAGRHRLTARVVAGDRGDTRSVTLVVEPPEENATGPGPANTSSGAARAGQSLVGVIFVAGAAFVLLMAALTLWGRRRN